MERETYQSSLISKVREDYRAETDSQKTMWTTMRPQQNTAKFLVINKLLSNFPQRIYNQRLAMEISEKLQIMLNLWAISQKFLIRKLSLHFHDGMI